jgi:hypothetical protein
LRSLRLRHFACRKAFDVQRTYSWVVARDDVRERVIGKDRAGASLLRQHADQIASQIFLCREQSQAGFRTVRHAGGVRAHEERRHDSSSTVDMGRVDGEMVAFESPRPGCTRTRLPEHCGVVKLRIAPWVCFDLRQNRFVLHDLSSSLEACGTQRGTQQWIDQRFLACIELCQGDAGASRRHVVPPRAPGRIEWQLSFCSPGIR